MSPVSYKTHLASCFPRAPKLSRDKVSPSPEIRIAGTSSSEDNSASPAAFDDAYSSQSSEYSSYSEFSSPPDTPPQLVQAMLSDILPADVPIVTSQAGDSPGEAITPSALFYAFTPKEQQLCSPCAPCHVPLAHPIPRISQPRSRLLDTACYGTYQLPLSSQRILLCGSEQGYAPQPGPPVLLGALELPYAPHGFDPVQEPSYHLSTPSHAPHYPSYCSQLDERIGCFPLAPLYHMQVLYN